MVVVKAFDGVENLGNVTAVLTAYSKAVWKVLSTADQKDDTLLDKQSRWMDIQSLFHLVVAEVVVCLGDVQQLDQQDNWLS